MSGYKVVMKAGAVPVKAWVNGVPFADNAKEQLSNIAQMPFVYKHVAAMPDVHLGKGATVGSVIATKGAIIPAAVGVDIGCGMMAAKTNLKASDLPDNLSALRSSIEAAVPHGRTNNGGAGDRGAWGNIPEQIAKRWAELLPAYDRLITKHPGCETKNGAGVRHMGTLGTGNHFIELCLDEDDCVWIMLHTGSRGLGNRIGTYFINLAKEEMRRWFINLPDQDLAYLPEGSQYFDDYCEAVSFAQNYARLNREVMMNNVLLAIREHIPHVLIDLSDPEIAVNCHHNYVTKERHFGDNVFVTRKGAVSAKEGELGIIPGSMGTRSYIVEGLGNRESFCSCSHGAGRVMSRGEARKLITLEEHKEATRGVECRKDDEVLDESPSAYKDIDSVMEAQKDLVRIKHTIKQVLCVKG